jgi:large subunit ribosomal protein L20
MFSLRRAACRLGRGLLPVPQEPCGAGLLGAVRGMASKKHKNLLKMAKGYRGRAKNCYSVAVQRVQKALQYAYRDRKQRKRDFRKLWITRLNAAGRQHGVPYNQVISLLGEADVELNRKVLSDIAVTEPYSFRAIMDTIRRPPSKGAAAARTASSSR